MGRFTVFAQTGVADCAGSACSAANGWQLRMQDGAAALEAAKPMLAEHDFELAIAERPEAPQAWVGLGQAQQKLGLLEAAESSFRKAHALDPASILAVTCLADALTEEKLSSAAIVYWKQALSLQPQNDGIKFSLAKALLDSGDNRGAAALFRELIADDYDRGPVLMDMGTAFARLGQYNEASGMYLQALSFPATEDPARLALIKSMMTLLRYRDAQPYARDYLETHPGDYEALYFNGVIEREVGNKDAAERDFAAAVSAAPNQYDAQLGLGAILRQQGKVVEAIPHLLQALQLQPNSKAAHFQLARAYRATGRPELARQQDEALQQEDSQDAIQTQIIVLGNKAAAAVEQHDTELAISTYKQIAQLDPHNARVLYDLAMIYLAQGHNAAGRALLQQANQIDPGMPEVNVQLGYLDMLDGSTKKAEAEMQQALKANPESVEALSNLGVLYAQRGQMDDAVRLLRLAVDIDGNYEQGHLNLGLVLASKGQLDEAYKELQQAVTLAPENNRAKAALAAITERMSAHNF